MVAAKRVVERLKADGGNYEDHRFSLPIPPDATVLFVTDEIKDQEILKVVETVRKAGNWKPAVPYILCLVNSLGSDELHQSTEYLDPRPWKIISLHRRQLP
jgi:hypothetical protein